MSVAVIILICASTISRDQCTMQTATDVFRGPMVASAAECVQQAQSLVANTVLLKGDDFFKVQCGQRKK